MSLIHVDEEAALRDAQQDLDAALLMESRHPRALQLMGVCCFKLDDDEGAVRYLDLAVAVDPQNATTVAYRQRALLKMQGLSYRPPPPIRSACKRM